AKAELLKELEEGKFPLDQLFDQFAIFADNYIEASEHHLEQIIARTRKQIAVLKKDPPNADYTQVALGSVSASSPGNGCQLPASSAFCTSFGAALAALDQAYAGGAQITALLVTTEDRYASAANAKNASGMALQLAAADVYLGALGESESRADGAAAAMTQALGDIGDGGVATGSVPASVASDQADSLSLEQLSDLLGALSGQLPPAVASALRGDLASAESAAYAVDLDAELAAFASAANSAGNGAGAFLALAAADAESP
ncbi:MAG TPA: hypothetical protein VL977_02455, partial [Solirubrobacteraceae bacterium]|nr:hypothetical protein [Solirubrobacteraceae bacterium]